MCGMHYMRWRRYGDVSFVKIARLSFKRIEEIKLWLLSHRNITSQGCWEWTGAMHDKKWPYGDVCIDGKHHKVHRLSARLFKGYDYNSRLLVCHECDNPPCFNPSHLWTGTDKDNCTDKMRKGRHVIKGGESHYKSKLKDAQIKEILKIYKLGETQKEIAKIYNVHPSTIRSVLVGETWKHIKKESS